MFDTWFETNMHVRGRVSVLKENAGGREAVLKKLVSTVADHLVELDVIERMGGFKESLNYLINRLPADKRARSGDLGEILATEYIESRTDYKVPVRRLRHKDDRNNAMRGDDVIGILKTDARPTVLKAEAKSRVSLSNSVIKKARKGLSKNGGRPNPGTLAFIQYLLAKENRMEESNLFKQLQDENSIVDEDVEHLLFTVSGNDPTDCLKDKKNARKIKKINLLLAGLAVDDHSAFVRRVFEDCLKLGGANGVT